ncbi:MAG: GTP-binding protein, partial [Bacteroidota bacterium]
MFASQRKAASWLPAPQSSSDPHLPRRRRPIPIVALCGFLGSGKTTLLRRWRRESALLDA